MLNLKEYLHHYKALFNFCKPIIHSSDISITSNFMSELA